MFQWRGEERDVLGGCFWDGQETDPCLSSPRVCLTRGRSSCWEEHQAW